MTRNEFNGQWHRMRRMWLKGESEYADYDDQADALFDEIKHWTFGQFKACVEYLIRTFKPRYKQEMPNMADFSSAESAVAQQVGPPPDDSPHDFEDLDYCNEVERRIEALSREERAVLRKRAGAWAKDHFPDWIWSLPNFTLATWRISEANIFCRENGMRVPKPYANVKPLKSVSKQQPLLKSMGNSPPPVDPEKRRAELHRQAQQEVTRSNVS